MKRPSGSPQTLLWHERSVLIVGCGSIGRRHARVLRSLGVSDLRIVDPVAAQRTTLQAEGATTASYDELTAALADAPDAAIICTPPGLHVAQSALALEAGVHVLCEKPLAASVREAVALRHIIRKSRRIFAAGFCMRHHEALRRAKHYIERGKIGRLVSIRCRMGEHLPTVRPDYRGMFTLEHMGAFDLVHEIDLACWFAARPFTRVTGLCGAFSDLGFTAPDVAEVVIQFGQDCLASVHLDFFGSVRVRATELMGTLGTIVVEYASWDRAELAIHVLSDGGWRRERFKTERDRMFRVQDRRFLEAIGNGSTPPDSDFESALQSLRVIERVNRPARGEPARV